MTYFTVSNLPKELLPGLKKLSNRFNFNFCDNGICIKAEKTNSKVLTVESKEGSLYIIYPQRCAFFRGVGLALERYENGCKEFTIEEEMQFDMCGLMYDSSRNGVLSVERTFDFLETMAIMGHNVYLPYIEDIYTLENYPLFGYMRGRYTDAELRAIDDYAFDLGIEVIPCIQTLAHMNQFLRWQKVAREYKDIDDILLVGTEKTKQLIDDMLCHFSKIFRTRNIHIGMDEAGHLGCGRYLEQNGYHKRIDIMHQHLNDVAEIARKYGLHPMMWDDMFSGSCQKLDGAAREIPQDASLVFWDYYNDSKEHYCERIDFRRTLCKDLIFAGGAWKWMGFSPNHTKTINSTQASLSAAKEKGIRRVFDTAWADDSSECPADSCLLGLQLFAEHAYHKEIDMQDFAKRLKFCTKLSFENWMKQEQFNTLPCIEPSPSVHIPSKYLLYQDPMCGVADYHARNLGEKMDVTKWYKDLEQYFAEHEEDTDDEKLRVTFRFYRAFAAVLIQKWNVGIRLVDTYKSGDKNELMRLAKEDLPQIADLVENFRNACFDEWSVNNKPFGFEILDIRLSGLKGRFSSAQKRIEQYCNGTVDSLPELEEERIAVMDDDFGDWNQAMQIASASRMGWGD